MILIAGGAGYIGSHTNKLLHQRGYQTVVFDNLSRGHRDAVQWGQFHQGDLADIAQIRECFSKYQISSVMHFSAFAYVGESVSEPAMYYKNNVAGTLNLLEVMRRFGINHFIFSSSCATYGIPTKTPITEDHEQKPINPYGRSKLMVEQVLADYENAYGLHSVILRYFNAAGADPEGQIGEKHQPETHLIPLVISAALGNSDKVYINGTDYDTPDGTCVRDYIHVNDLADAHIKAMQYMKKSDKSEVFNLGNELGHSVLDVIESVKRVSSHEIPVVNKDRRKGDPPILISSSQKARDIMGWTPEYTDIDAIVETAWNWHVRDAERNGT